jgi:hypothetical protein
MKRARPAPSAAEGTIAGRSVQRRAMGPGAVVLDRRRGGAGAPATTSEPRRAFEHTAAPRIKLWSPREVDGVEREAQRATEAGAGPTFDMREGTPPRVQGQFDPIVDQHADTHLPSAQELEAIAKQIASDPTVAAHGLWNTASPASKALAAKLMVTMKQHLAAKMPSIRALMASPKLKLSAFEGAGKAAKRVVDARFGSFASAAALTARQARTRSTFRFIPGAQLLDRTNPAHFTPNPVDLAGWIAETDSLAGAVQAQYHFDKDRSKAECAWLKQSVLVPFARAYAPDLKLYDIYGFAAADDGRVKIAPVLTTGSGFATVAPGGGVPSPAERALRWDMWETLVHEYIHTLEHPSFEAARHENRILYEGICEMFGEEVLQIWIPIAKAAGDAALRADVEGAMWPQFAPEFVPQYDPGDYADYATRAKNVRTILGRGGENAVRAAFFQGHVELIGLAKTGALAPAPSKAAPPPGMRYHRVVGVGRAIESLDQIATQNGVTVAALKLANSAARLNHLKVGGDVLIPVH